MIKGKDDKEYFALMSEYKMLRRRDTEAANEILSQAFDLAQNGDVSNEAQLGAAYL